MKKNLILLALLLLISGIAYWQYSQQTKDTFAGNEHTQFAVENAAENLSRIFIADRDNNAILLEKKSGSWTFTNKNTGKSYPANPGALHTLLQTVQNIRSRAPVSKAATPNVVKQLAARSKKVELYDNRNRLIRTYYVGGSADGGEGTFMIMENSETPYIVYYPNWMGSLDTRYSLDEKVWRDRSIFNLKPENLQWVELKYLEGSQQQHSFRIEAAAEGYKVSPLSAAASSEPVNQLNASAFIKGFDIAIAELIVTEPKLLDSVAKIPAFARISYQTKDAEQPSSFSLHPANVIKDGAPRQSLQRYYVKNQQGDCFLIQHIVIGKILWGYEFFFQKVPVVLKQDEDNLNTSLPPMPAQ